MAIGQWKGFINARASYDRLNAFYQAVPDEGKPLQLPEPTGHIAVQNVTAAPPNGAVRLDGATYDQWNRDILGPHIGYLPQDVALFDGTIKDNIARFDPQAADEAIVEAAKNADVHNMILQMPNGYETLIGSGNLILSGGQVQRIALARALYGDPKLLVLDEPNANLDADGDKALTNAIAGCRKRGNTVIVMTHRPSAIAAVDTLLMLRAGRVEEFGPKDKVLKSLQDKHKVAQQGSKPKTVTQEVSS